MEPVDRNVVDEILMAISGMMMVRGKKGLAGRGGILALMIIYYLRLLLIKTGTHEQRDP
ncbi:MAG: hypothetical protein KAT15_19425 [Bacteroidales bacterium]|nr:hypothetical protein [Bacteroidales bacterium]